MTSTLASEAIEKMVRGLENGDFFFTIIDFWMSDLARAQVHEEAVNHSQPNPLFLLMIEVHQEDIPEEKTNVFIKSPQSKDFQRSQVM